jgi:DNA-binding CsgD family transcriptional regulator
MNVARRASDGAFSPGEVESLVGLACLVLPMIPLSRERPTAAAQLSVQDLEARFALHCEALTLRERQVCARAATGMGVEATAMELGIASSSVLTYRQRAYQRLGVASSLELRALVTH